MRPDPVLEATYRSMSLDDLRRLQQAFEMDRAKGDEHSQAFCSRRLQVINSLLSERSIGREHSSKDN